MTPPSTLHSDDSLKSSNDGTGYIYILSHLSFQSSELDWSLSEKIQNALGTGHHAPDIVLSTDPFSLSFLFPYLISSCCLPADLPPALYYFSNSTNASFWVALTDEETEASNPAQGNVSTQGRMESTVWFSQKQNPLGSTASEQIIRRKEGSGEKPRVTIRDLYIPHYNSHPKILTAKPMFPTSTHLFINTYGSQIQKQNALEKFTA